MNTLNNQSIRTLEEEPPQDLCFRIIRQISYEQRKSFVVKRLTNCGLLFLSTIGFIFFLNRLVIQLSKTSIVYFIKSFLSSLTLAPSILGDACLAILESFAGSTLTGVSLCSIFILLIILKLSGQKRVIQIKF
jgi:hypothetical protein